jgi:hypothetical protein
MAAKAEEIAKNNYKVNVPPLPSKINDFVVGKSLF